MSNDTTVLDDEMGWSKKENYCSSSSEDDEEGTAAEKSDQIRGGSSSQNINNYSPGLSRNTGPKGVLEDWRRFKKLETDLTSQRHRELLALAKRVSLNCTSHKDDELAAAAAEARKEEEEEAEFEDEEDAFLNEYAARRMREMILLNAQAANRSTKFGVLYELSDADAFLKAIDEDSKKCTVVLHLYENKIKNCELLDASLSKLAQRYSMVKFCRVRSALVGASKKLQSLGLPALLTYRDGQLIGNFVRLGDDLGDDFDLENVEQYLKEFGVLPDLGEVTGGAGGSNTIRDGGGMKGGRSNALDSDSDD